MSSAHRTRQPHEALPPEIYLPLVDSLFQDARSLVTGSIVLTLSILITYWKTSNVLLLCCALAFLAVACARGLFMRTYARARSEVTTCEVARRWENRYVAGASTSMALLGLWCFIAFAFTDDAFANLISFSMTIAYAMGIFGRNYGNSRFVIVQILCAWVPMTLA
ncbi:MAG: diguanylate cyclase, partial [Xanthobacteraceae bacterium]